MTDAAKAPMLGQGLGWRQMAVGQCWRSMGRTITEHDLMSFVTLAGMQEPLFLDASRETLLGARPVPGALTYSLVEGMMLRLVQGTGLAMLGTSLTARAPVRVGDTIRGFCTVSDIRPTSKGDRAVVEFTITVHNQRNETVMDYTVKRLLAAEAEEETT